MLSGLVWVYVIAAALSQLYTQGKWSWQFLKLRTGGSQHTPLFWEELVQLLFCIWWPHSPTSPWCPWGSRSRSSLHLQQSCPHSPRGLQWALLQLHWNLQTALSTGEEEKAFHHNRNRSRARRNHINCKCSAINAKAKMDDNTNANMIYSNLQSRQQYFIGIFSIVTHHNNGVPAPSFKIFNINLPPVP